MSPDDVGEVTRAMDLSGVFANGTLGGEPARGGRLDLFGFLAIGIVSGSGVESCATLCCSTAPPRAGTSRNVIPELAELLLNVRTYDEHTRRVALAAVRRIVRTAWSGLAAVLVETVTAGDDTVEVAARTVTQESELATNRTDLRKPGRSMVLPYHGGW